MNYNDYKIGLIAIKYIPILMFLIMWLHTGFLIIGINGPVADIIAGSALIPSVLILAMSQLFKFCVIHKALTLYSLAIDLCINFQRFIGFGNLLMLSRIIMFSIGIVIFTILLYKFKDYKNKCCKPRKTVVEYMNY